MTEMARLKDNILAMNNNVEALKYGTYHRKGFV